MPFRKATRPSRLNSRLFTPEGKARPVIVEIPGLIESVIGPLPEGTRVLVVGSQARETFRTREDSARLVEAQLRKYIETQDPGERDMLARAVFILSDPRFCEGLIAADTERLGEAMEPSLVLIDKLSRVAPSDLDILLTHTSKEQLAAIHRRVDGNAELLALLKEMAEMPVDIFVSGIVTHSPCFDIRRSEWLEYV